jgi:dTDP-4-dehydrorhamnose 3,5-epimerase
MSLSIKKTSIQDVMTINIPVFCDCRGAFEVSWEEESFKKVGIAFSPSSAYHSYNSQTGTIRALHFQRPPHGQAKLVTCVSGKTWDVVLDLRPESQTFRRWAAVELSAASGKSVYIPVGCAHGFATLEDNTIIAYLIQGEYRPKSAAVVRWNDPALGINWPVSDPIISDKDRHAPDLDSYLRNLKPELET